MTSKTSFEITDGAAVLRLDDGKANAIEDLKTFGVLE